MIEAATAMNTQASPDAAYKSWEAAGRKAVMRHDLNERTAGPMPAFGTMMHQTALAAQTMHYAPGGPSSLANNSVPDIAMESVGGDDEAFSFGDVIDMINPLQHLPVIGTLYRKFTGDTIKPFANIIGGAIFGGPVGAVSSTANVIIKDRTGKDIAENALSMIGFDAQPQGAAKPDIMISNTTRDHGVDITFDLPGTTLAVANLSANGRKNFSAQAIQQSRQVWNG